VLKIKKNWPAAIILILAMGAANTSTSIAAPVGSGWGLPTHFCGIIIVKPGCKEPPNPTGFSIFQTLPDSTAAAPEGEQPALVGIHCEFAGDIMMLAKTVSDCESAGGEVHPDLKAALEPKS